MANPFESIAALQESPIACLDYGLVVDGCSDRPVLFERRCDDSLNWRFAKSANCGWTRVISGGESAAGCA